MAVYTSPGLYPREVDFSAYVQSLSTSIGGMVVVTERGPIAQPIYVSSFEQFVRTFGSYIPGGWGAHAAKAFFENGGGQLYVVRTVHYDSVSEGTTTAAKASYTFKDADDADSLTFSAVDEGTWGNKINVALLPSDIDDHISILVTYKNETEAFNDVNLDPESDDFIVKRINGTSALVTVQVAPNAKLPATGQSANLDGGDDSDLSALTDQDFIGDPVLRTGLYAFDAVTDVNFIFIPGRGTAEILAAGVTYAENRKDIMFLAETPQGLTPQEAVDFRKATGNFSNNVAQNSSYAALYYPWLIITDPMTGQDLVAPPTPFVAGIFARNDSMGEVWTAPAGLNRAIVRGIKNVERVLNQGDRDLLYPAGINPLVKFSGTGVVVWGQKTLQTKASATDRINVRRLLIYIEKSISASGQYLIFEPHDKATWDAFVRLVTPFLQDIKDRRGLYDFHVQCDEETNTPARIDRNEMYARVYLKPTKTAEFIPIDFAIASTGANFEELFSAA